MPKNIDPSRTILLRRKFAADLQRRFMKLKREIVKQIDDNDILGLKPKEQFTIHAREYAFLTSDEKIKSFNKFVTKKVNEDVLEGKWTDKYIESAYKQGTVRAYTETHKKDLQKPAGFVEGSKAQFLKSAFMQPERMSKLRLLYTRTYEELKGITAATSQKISRILAEGIAHGEHPSVMAREMANTIDSMSRSRAKTLAQTEIMNAHTDGTLDGYKELGVEELGVEVEWSTAGDDRVCTECESMSGTTYTVDEARGVLPAHPNCFEDKNTPIYTQDGWRPICKIKKGDMVLTHTGEFQKVIQIFKTRKKNPVLVKIEIERGRKRYYELEATENHPVLIADKWLALKDVKIGMKIKHLISIGDFYKFGDFEIISIVKYNTRKSNTLYNFSVEKDESYVAKGFVVHNCRCVFIPKVK